MKVAPVGNPAHRKRTYVKNRRATVKDELDGDWEAVEAMARPGTAAEYFLTKA